jgi:hypothetical protein
MKTARNFSEGLGTKRLLSCVLSALGVSVLMLVGCAKTDDVDIEIPADPNEGYTFQIPDRAFGEYMVYLGVPGVQQRVDTLDTGVLQTNFYLNPELVVGVNSLSLSKTSANVSALEAAGLAEDYRSERCGIFQRLGHAGADFE